MKAEMITDRIKEMGDPKRVSVLLRYFKTGKGEYAQGDVFTGLYVPQIRTLANEFQDISLSVTAELIQSPIHEARLLALLILVRVFKKAQPAIQEQIFDFYLQNTRFINNWDLVDLSAQHIVGMYLRSRNRLILYSLAGSGLVWDRRIAIMATFDFIKHGDFEDTLKLAGILVKDKEDLIHKAVGWMLREIGKRDFKAEEEFLRAHYKKMPRTMLRYAIEKFPEGLRKQYLHSKI